MLLLFSTAHFKTFLYHLFAVKISNNPAKEVTRHEMNINTIDTPVSTDIDSYQYIPAHLECHDNEKNWRSGGFPTSDIILKDCFNIYPKIAGARNKDHIISVVSIYDTLDICFAHQDDMLTWLEILLCCQQGGRSKHGRIARPIYEHMWEINVKGFESENDPYSCVFEMLGPRRLVATEDAFKFFEMGSVEPITFPYKEIRGHKHHKRDYIIQTGRLTQSGRGKIYIDCKEHYVSAQIYETVSLEMFKFWYIK